MIHRDPHFEVRPSLITGDSADVYLHRTQRVLRDEGLNPVVVMEFSASQEGILCGTVEVKAVLSKVTSEGNREVWAVEEGTEVAQGEVCVTIRAPYSSFGLYETAITGILAQSTGWAKAAHELVVAAEGHPVVSVGAHNVHPSVAAVMDYSAIVGGCQTGSTALGARLAGTQPITSVSGALLQIMGDPATALEAFDRSVAADVPRIAYLDPRGDVAAQTAEIARLLGSRLTAVRLGRVPGGRQIPAEVIQEVRARLDEHGCRNVAIVVSGDLSPDRIRSLLSAGSPIDVFHDSGYIASANPVPFRPNIRTISDRSVPQEVEPPPPNPRLLRVL